MKNVHKQIDSINNLQKCLQIVLGYHGQGIPGKHKRVW